MAELPLCRTNFPDFDLIRAISIQLYIMIFCSDFHKTYVVDTNFVTSSLLLAHQAFSDKEINVLERRAIASLLAVTPFSDGWQKKIVRVACPFPHIPPIVHPFPLKRWIIIITIITIIIIIIIISQ